MGKSAEGAVDTHPEGTLPMPLRWTAERLDQLESAARRGRRVMLMRRGTEYVVVALRVVSSGRRETLIARVPMTGEEMEFVLDELEAFQVVE